MRPLTFEQACAHYSQRFTMEHVPRWTQVQRHDGTYYAPPYRSDLEWYNHTYFAGEHELAHNGCCYSLAPTWPLGRSLDTPYKKEDANHG